MVTAVRAFPFAGEHPPTDRQREAILREDHTLIEAGAGSGKTTTLVNKILHLLGAECVEGERVAAPCELHEIAAITFTNAAAADFKAKLRARLRAVADFHAGRGEGDEERRWRARVHEVDRARIGTIHSFCGGILREFGFRLGLDPRFAILDEGEASLLRGEVVREVLRDALEADDARAVALCRAFGVDGAEGVVARVTRRAGEAADVLAAWFEVDGGPAAKLASSIAQQRSAWELPDGEGEWHPVADAEAAALGGAALSLACEARKRLLARLERESALDFDTVIERTLEVLRTRGDVRGALRARLRWLFIDEFQDTDRAQLEIAERLADIQGGVVRQGSPRLCIVGDPKQSIYRFRGADVTVWERTLRRFEALGVAPIPLDVNFRSAAPIVAFVNATFDGLIGCGRDAVRASGHEVAFAPLAPMPMASRDDRAVELLQPQGGYTGTAEQRRRSEIRAVATRLRELKEAGASWRDMAILFRARGPMNAAEEELRALGVPCHVAGGRGFLGRREVRDVRLLLRALADARDDVAWLGTLRAPWVALRDETLLAFRAAHPRAPLSAILASPAAGDDAATIARARGWLEPLRALRDRVPVAEMIGMAVERSGYAAQLLTRDGGELALANLRKLARLADRRPGDTLGEFVAWMDEREDGAAQDGDAVLFTADDDVVTLTTVHGAKGLEWKVVVLADTTERKLVMEQRIDPLLFDRECGAGLRYEDADGNAGGAHFVLRTREVQLARSEEKRLLYVAATRAKSLLILCACERQVAEAGALADVEREGTGAAHWLLRALREGHDGAYAYAYRGEAWHAHESIVPAGMPTVPVPMAVPSLAAVLAQVPDPALAARVACIEPRRGLPRRSATELMTLAQGARAWHARGADGSPLHQAQGISPRVIGDVLHVALEQVRDAAAQRELLESEIVARGGEAAGSPAVRDAVAVLERLVEASRAHPDVMRMTEAGAERELGFTWFARSGTGVHDVRGAMDLVALVDGVPEILDFKSTAIAAGGESAAAAPYRVQQATYTAALAQLTGVSPSRFVFMFPATGGTHTDALDAATVAAHADEVGRLLDLAAATRP